MVYYLSLTFIVTYAKVSEKLLTLLDTICFHFEIIRFAEMGPPLQKLVLVFLVLFLHHAAQLGSQHSLLHFGVSLKPFGIR